MAESQHTDSICFMQRSHWSNKQLCTVNCPYGKMIHKRTRLILFTSNPRCSTKVTYKGKERQCSSVMQLKNVFSTKLSAVKYSLYNFLKVRAYLFKLLVLSNQQSKTPKHSIYFHRILRIAGKSHIRGAGTSQCLAFLLKN